VLFALPVTFISTQASAQAASCTSVESQAIANQQGNISGSCTQSGLTINYSCSYNNSTSTETCNISGPCSGTVTGNSSGISSNNVVCQSAAAQSAGRAAVQASQISLGAVNTHITNVRDSIQQRLFTPVGRPLGFAGEATSNETPDSPFARVDASFNTLDDGLRGLFAYADPKSPIPMKAPPAPPPPTYSWAGWAQGFVDYESRYQNQTLAGSPIGRDTTTGGGIGGVDVTRIGLTSAQDAGVLGLLGGDTSAFVRNADGTTALVDGPSIGVYGVYVNGGFSVDGTFKADFLGISEGAAGMILTNLRLTNYTESGDISYKREMGSWWYEPTVGVSNTNTVWDNAALAMAMNLTNGDDVRVTGGVRWGTGWDAAGVHYEGTLSTLLYDDVIITGGTVATAIGVPLAPTGEGLIFGQLIGKLEAQWTRNWSGYVEGEVRGSDNIIGVAGRVGVRYTFN